MKIIAAPKPTLLFVALWIGAVAASAPSPAEQPAAPDLRQTLLDAHNQERAAEKLPPLTLDDQLDEAARLHAQDMVDHDKMTHEGADGSTPSERVRRVGYHYLKTGENVAMWQRDVPAVMEAWMESPGHKKNILGEFTQMGAAKVDDDEGRPYWCVVFGTPIPRLDPVEAARDALTKINEAREKGGKEPLKADGKLDEVARKLAIGLAASSRKPAEEREVPDLAALMKDAGVSFKNLMQVVSAGEPTADSFVAAMTGDEGRNEALMGEFEAVGIGYARDAEDAPFWCLLLVEE
ncbi:CAP domain-containing protein [Paludisphaera soli]|uniref:CAP domain-containing protein n=1 Tax=Paludisphaera soli TaxID=2712865 RepID=UPI0013EDC5A8|nr:CAP domain-containing protein [Paludisphaera soli]